MPHLIVEISDGLTEAIEPESILYVLHDAALASGQFNEADIKVRIRPYDHAFVAGSAADFIHVTVLLISGRDTETKQALCRRLLSALEGLGLKAASISVDARDLDRDIYVKQTR